MSFLNEQPMDEFGNYICDGCNEPVIPAPGDELTVDRSQWGHGDGPLEPGEVFVPDRRPVKPRSHMVCVLGALGGG